MRRRRYGVASAITWMDPPVTMDLAEGPIRPIGYCNPVGANIGHPNYPTHFAISVTNRRLDGLRLVLRATGGIAVCQVIRLQTKKEECNMY